MDPATCRISKQCYHWEEEYMDHIVALVEKDQPGEPEEYKKENYEGENDQL
jgi:hypothetical protein